ncbi:glycosyltransferase [Pseudonocardia halophobica]|uniref:glycosyltransferase n=1 Tax=Pseudonocardia halophobica TaxID=29401 RepID=UPI003D93D1F6
MRVLISSIAAHGHTYPLLPFAIAAREAGHEVTYAIAPSFHPLVERLGFRPVAAGGEIREAFGQVWAQSGKDPRDRFSTPPDEVMAMAGRVFGEVLPRRTAAELAPVLAELRPDVVVHEAGDLGAGLAAKVAGIRGLCHGFGRVAGGKMLARAGDHVGGLAAELGLDPAVVAGPGLGDPFLDVCPRSLQDPAFLAAFTPDRAPRVPLRPVPFAEPAPLPPRVGEPGPPLVYLTLGTAFAEGSVLRTAIEGLGRLPARVLVAAGPMIDAALVDDLPDTVRVEQWVPQADVLPHAALVVHHGGSGTTLGALASGVPQLLLPQGADQFDNAGAVLAVGAGRRLLPGEATPDAVAEVASSLLTDPEPRAAAGAVAREIAAMPSPAEVVAGLLS